MNKIIGEIYCKLQMNQIHIRLLFNQFMANKVTYEFHNDNGSSLKYGVLKERVRFLFRPVSP